MGQLLTFNANDREHKNFADTLGILQGRVVTGDVTTDTENADYHGHELEAAFPGSKGTGAFLKADCTGAGETKTGRSQNRIVVKVDDARELVEGAAWLWRHDARVLQLDSGFFQAAQTMRKYILTKHKQQVLARH